MERFYGTIDFEETAGLEEFALPQTTDFKGCAAGWKNLDSQGIWQAVL